MDYLPIDEIAGQIAAKALRAAGKVVTALEGRMVPADLPGDPGRFRSLWLHRMREA